LIYRAKVPTKATLIFDISLEIIYNIIDKTIKNGLLTTADLMNQLNGMHDPEFSHIPN